MKFSLIALGLLAVASAAFAAESKAAREIRMQDAKWVKAAESRSAKEWVKFYAPGAAVLPPNYPVCDTDAKILGAMTELFTLPGVAITWTPTKIVVAKSGEVGYSYGIYRLTYRGADGSTVVDHGKNVEIWHMQKNGQWKCAVDTWNSDLSTDPLTAEWQVRYEDYCAAISAIDLNGWSSWLAPEIVWVKADGTTSDRAGMLTEYGPLFKAKSIRGFETVLYVRQVGETVVVAYHEEWVIKFADGKKVTFNGGGTDTWQKVGSKWQIVKTVDNPAKPKTS